MNDETPRLHPDAAWLRSLIEDLRAYEAHPEWIDSPTSSITGGGAIAAAEDQFARISGTRFAVLLPSATYGMRIALQAVGVRPGDSVVIPGVDWIANRAAVLSIGATPVPVNVTRDTLTICPEAARRALTANTKAIIATHTHGVPADVPALARLGIPVLEDATGAFGATLNGEQAGTLGTAAVLSLGPGKELDCGEGAVLLTNADNLWERTIANATHPVRQTVNGIRRAADHFSVRVHPVVGILALMRLGAWKATAAKAAAQQSITAARQAGLETLVGDVERQLTTPWIPVRLTSVGTDGFTARLSGAQDLRDPKTCDLETIRLVQPTPPQEHQTDATRR